MLPGELFYDVFVKSSGLKWPSLYSDLFEKDIFVIWKEKFGCCMCSFLTLYV